MKRLQNIKMVNPKRVIKCISSGVIIIIMTQLSACSFLWWKAEPEQFSIIEQGKNIDSRPNMSEVCTGFYVSQEKFDAFFEHSKITHEENLNKRYQALPCYSSGITYIEGEKFNWTLRAGGVGEFYNDTTSFTKVCGVACCKKVAGIC
jgi:hypothetical protein